MKEVKIIFAETKLDCEHLLGTFLDDSHYDTLVDFDCDFYGPKEVSLFSDPSEDPEWLEENCIFKFRKGFFTEEEQAGAYEGLREAAGESQNRGLAAGPRGEKLQNRDWVSAEHLAIIDIFQNKTNTLEKTWREQILDILSGEHKIVDETRGSVWLRSAIPNDWKFENWAKSLVEEKDESVIEEEVSRVISWISDTTYANPVYSGIAGYFDRYPRIPYGRETSYTKNNPEKFKKSFPFLQRLAEGFKELLPIRYGKQEECCKKLDPAFYVPKTPFTTITVNKTFRTAAHRDAGDLAEGFSNLSVVSNGKTYTGGYLVLPEYRVAVNIRPGDLLLIANHSGIHGNTPIEIGEDGERISLVCYFREKMLLLGSKEYEDARYEFVESRRKNKDHPLWRPLWNGVSEKMWESQEWYDFLSDKLGEEVLLKYHPESKEVA